MASINRDLLNNLYNNAYTNITQNRPRNKNGYYLIFWNDKKNINMYNQESYDIRKEITKILKVEFRDVLFFVSNDKIQIGFKEYNEVNIKKILDLLSSRYLKYSNTSFNNKPIQISNERIVSLNKNLNTRIEFKKIYKIDITDNIYDALCNYDPNYINSYNFYVCKIKVKYIDDFIINKNNIVKEINEKLNLININIYIKKIDSKVEINFNKKEKKSLGKILEMIETWDSSFYYLHPSSLVYSFDKKPIKKEISIKQNIVLTNHNEDILLEKDTDIKNIIIGIINFEKTKSDEIKDDETKDDETKDDDSDSDSDIDAHIEFSCGFGSKGTRKTKNETFLRGASNRHTISNESKKKNNFADDYIEIKKVKSSTNDNTLNENIGIIKQYLGNGRVKVLKCNIEYDTNIEEVTATICGSLRRFQRDNLKLGDFVSIVTMFDDKYFIEAKLSTEIIKYNIDNGYIKHKMINNLLIKLNNINDTIDDDDDIIFKDDEFEDFINISEESNDDITYKLLNVIDKQIGINNKTNIIKQKKKTNFKK
jgi:hypothetical protein